MEYILYTGMLLSLEAQSVNIAGTVVAPLKGASTVFAIANSYQVLGVVPPGPRKGLVPFVVGEERARP
eukprot:12004318-Heterocapsa_arctica.AAC.1